MLLGNGSPVRNICERIDHLYVQYKNGDLLRWPVDRIKEDEAASFLSHSLDISFLSALSFCRLQLLGDNCILLPAHQAC